MKRYTISQARERLADVLNEAEGAGSVVIERRDVRYVIRAEPKPRPPASRRSVIETLDRAVADGQWKWKTAASGVRFGGRRPRS
jgi:hypothetical protein